MPELCVKVSLRVQSYNYGHVHALLLYSAAAVTGDAYAIRLVGGAYEWEGRVEVSVNGEWGTVCSLSAITESEYVDVICRQLGYGRLLGE